MNNIQERLQKCFSLVLFEVPEEMISQVSMSSVAEWDSLAMVNLIALVEEEFNLQVTDADLLHFRSFQQILHYLAARAEARG